MNEWEQIAERWRQITRECFADHERLRKEVVRLRAQVEALERDKAELSDRLKEVCGYLDWTADSEDAFSALDRASATLAAHGAKP